MPDPMMYPDEDATYHSRIKRGLTLFVLRVHWVCDGGGGRAFPLSWQGIQSDGRKVSGPVREFWDLWLHEDLVTGEVAR